MKKISILISILIISTLLLNGCSQKEPGVSNYNPSRVLNLEVGKTASTEKLEVKLISVERTKSYYDTISNDMREIKPGKIYVLVEAELKSTHSESIPAGDGDFYLVDDKGTRYKPGIYYGENALELFRLEPNEKIKGQLVFGIPESTIDFKIEYDITFLTF